MIIKTDLAIVPEINLKVLVHFRSKSDPRYLFKCPGIYLGNHEWKLYTHTAYPGDYVVDNWEVLEEGKDFQSTETL